MKYGYSFLVLPFSDENGVIKNELYHRFIRKNKILVEMNSLCYDNLFRLAQIMTKLASLHSAFNELFENV